MSHDPECRDRDCELCRDRTGPLVDWEEIPYSPFGRDPRSLMLTPEDMELLRKLDKDDDSAEAVLEMRDTDEES